LTKEKVICVHLPKEISKYAISYLTSVSHSLVNLSIINLYIILDEYNQENEELKELIKFININLENTE